MLTTVGSYCRGWDCIQSIPDKIIHCLIRYQCIWWPAYCPNVLTVSRYMHMVFALLCLTMVWLQLILPRPFRITSPAQGQPNDLCNSEANIIHWPLSDLNKILDEVIFRLILLIDGWKLWNCTWVIDCQRTSWMISQHLFRHQAITWANVDTVLYRHMLSLGQNELEQLECMRSEDIPRRLMITHTLESYWIPSQKKTKSKFQI